MTDKLEALSHPVFEIEVSGNTWLNCSAENLTPTERADFSDWPDGINKLYSQEYVTALLAALEEANSKNYLTDMLEWRKKAQAAEKELGQWRDVATAAAQDDADWRKLVNTKNHAICQLANAVIAQINKTEAAGRREEHLKATVDVLSAKNAELEQRLQQPIKLPTGFSHQDGAPHALLGTGDVMISHIKWADAQGIAFAPTPAGKSGIGVNFDAEMAGKYYDEIGAVFVVKSTSVQSLEVLKEAVQMAIDGFKVEVEGE